MQGHHRDGSGIQNHSAGSHYPLVVAVIGEQRAEVWFPDGQPPAQFPIAVNSRKGRLEAYSRALNFAEDMAPFWRR